MLNILITSGGTKVPIDRVRDITNKSNGTFGTKIANAFLRHAGNEIENLTFFKARGSKSPFEFRFNLAKPHGGIQTDLALAMEYASKYADVYHEPEYVTFDDYRRGLIHLLMVQKWDIIIVAAAVSDYEVANYVNGKVRSGSTKKIELKDAVKVIHEVRGYQSDSVLVGFKLLVDSEDSELIDAAHKVLVAGQCDFVVANDLSDIEKRQHRIMIVDGHEKPQWMTMEGENESLAGLVALRSLRVYRERTGGK